jgi:hypothetical protein
MKLKSSIEYGDYLKSYKNVWDNEYNYLKWYELECLCLVMKMVMY